MLESAQGVRTKLSALPERCVLCCGGGKVGCYLAHGSKSEQTPTHPHIKFEILWRFFNTIGHIADR